MNINAAFEWKCEPQAEKLLLDVLGQCKAKNPDILKLEEDLLKYTSTRLFDWIDHMSTGNSPKLEKALTEAGFVAQQATPTYRVFHHPRAQLPRLLVRDEEHGVEGVAVSVENIIDYLMVRGLSKHIEGSPFSGYRRCKISTEDDVSLWVVERRGEDTMEPTHSNAQTIELYLEAMEQWLTRPRDRDDDDEGMALTLLLAEDLVLALGQNRAAWLVLECERKYWQARNRAGQIQKNRQDSLGMGWANHDHHTFRSSRRQFAKLVRLFEILGFKCRERYFAGEEAGWGAQIMENPTCRLVLFLDVDLAPDEITHDFAHQPIPELTKHGTIGLWCALHGDSILQAGMHHLEAQFMFDELSQDLKQYGVGMMDPFSSFPYLRQAFTAGDKWPVKKERVDALLEKGYISQEQAEKFLKEGALGSHLENLQRREGYKGFNQKNVSIIIKKTDPRLAAHT